MESLCGDFVIKHPFFFRLAGTLDPVTTPKVERPRAGPGQLGDALWVQPYRDDGSGAFQSSARQSLEGLFARAACDADHRA